MAGMMRSVWFVPFVIVAACSAEDESGPQLRGAGTTAAHTDGGTDDDGQDSGSSPSPSDGGAQKDVDTTPQGPEESGEATYYDAEGLGACGIEFPSDYLVAAINDEQYSKANCGRCVSVTGPKGTVVVRILDKCPGCDSGDLDLSETAFSKIADKSAGRVKITWHFVECPF
jgi:expansin